MKNVLIIGATSAIAQQTARLYAQQGDNLILVGRNEAALKVLQSDLELRGASKVECMVVDLSAYEQHTTIIDVVAEKFPVLDITLIAYGILGRQEDEEKAFDKTLESMVVNCLSVMSLLTVLAPVYENQQGGTIAVISSVAGDRGRQSNYVYGTAKGALSIYMQGLRNRLSKQGVNVLTIKPGFVDTPMTTEFKKGMLWVGPDEIARGIVKAIRKKKDVVYLPWFWKWIMLIIKLIPEPVFKRMSL